MSALCREGTLTKGEVQSGRRKNHSHTCYVVIDSCHMSIPALRGNGGGGSVTNRGQQRASEPTRPSEAGRKAQPQTHRKFTPSRSTCHLTNVHSTLALCLI